MGKVFDFTKYIGGNDMDQLTSRRSPEIEAQEIIKAHGIEMIPIDPLSIAEREKIEVYEAEFTNRNVSGLIKKENGETIIYINEVDAATRKRFTIAHELGHYYLHLTDKATGNFLDSNEIFHRTNDMFQSFSDPAKEREANQFAAALLMPEEHMIREWYECYNPVKMAAKFQVSITSMEYRLRNLGLV